MVHCSSHGLLSFSLGIGCDWGAMCSGFRLSHASIASVAKSLNLGGLSDEVLDFVAGSIEFHLHDLLQEARKVCEGL